MPNQGPPSDVLPDGTVLPDNPYVAAAILSATPFDPALARMQRAGSGLASAGQDALSGFVNFLRVPGDVAAGKYSLDEITRMAPGYALGLAGLGTPIGAATVPEDSLGIFAGTRSLTHSPTALERANILERYRNSPEDIQALTGWFRGPDSQWRYTIPDEGAQLNPSSFRQNELAPDLVGLSSSAGRPLSNVLMHPEFFSAYPRIGSYYVRPVPLSDIGRLRGAFSGLDVPNPSFYLAQGEPRDVLSTLLHEVQHSIQDTEGFASGGGVAEFLPEGFGARVERHAKSVADVEAFAKQLHPDLSDVEHARIGSMLHGYISPLGEQLLGKLNPLLRAEVQALSRESLGLQATRKLADESYTRLAGEVEARAVQTQFEEGDWTSPIWKHPGYIPFSQQIVKTPGKASASLVPVEHDPFQFTPVDHDPFEAPR